MMYLGGKSKLAKWIVNEAETLSRSLPVWDAFCGSLAVAAEFARRGRSGTASDKHPALISLYLAVKDGWDPPETLTESDYAYAKTVSDTDPIKAFAGFGCSFGGKYFGGYARDPKSDRNYCGQARRAILRDVRLCVDAGWSFHCQDFLRVSVAADEPKLLYCDPPYAGTTGYSVGAFDTQAFWERCSSWHRAGSPVLVSEYAGAGSNVKLHAERSHFVGVSGKLRGSRARTERLFTFESAA